MVQVVLGLLLATGDLLGVIGTGAILAALLFIAGTLVLGFCWEARPGRHAWSPVWEQPSAIYLPPC